MNYLFVFLIFYFFYHFFWKCKSSKYELYNFKNNDSWFCLIWTYSILSFSSKLFFFSFLFFSIFFYIIKFFYSNAIFYFFSFSEKFFSFSSFFSSLIYSKLLSMIVSTEIIFNKYFAIILLWFNTIHKLLIWGKLTSITLYKDWTKLSIILVFYWIVFLCVISYWTSNNKLPIIDILKWSKKRSSLFSNFYDGFNKYKILFAELAKSHSVIWYSFRSVLY